MYNMLAESRVLQPEVKAVERIKINNRKRVKSTRIQNPHKKRGAQNMHKISKFGYM